VFIIFQDEKFMDHNLNIFTFRCDYRRDFGLNDWICYTLYIHTVRDYRQYSVIVILHTLQFTVTHSLRYSAFISRILATDLSQSHWHFKSLLKFSCHNITNFLLLFCDCKFRRLDSITLNYCSQLLLLLKSLCLSFCNFSVQTPRKTSLYFLRRRV
jgi:hypothetical protein